LTNDNTFYKQNITEHKPSSINTNKSPFKDLNKYPENYINLETNYDLKAITVNLRIKPTNEPQTLTIENNHVLIKHNDNIQSFGLDNIF